MSTLYYKPAPPITNLRVEDVGIHKKLSIWTNHGLSGTLIIRKEDFAQFVVLLAPVKIGCFCPVFTRNEAQGIVVEINDNTISDDTVLVSEEGEVITLGEIKALSKKGKMATMGEVRSKKG